MSTEVAGAKARPPEGRRVRDVAELALVALVVGLPLCLGSAPFWVLWPLVALSCAALLCTWWGARRDLARWPFLVAFPLAAAGFCALQLVPLPGPLLNLLSPQAAGLRDFALEPLGLGSAWPVSLDPPSTWRALAVSLSCAAVFVASAQLAHSRARKRRLFAALAGIGGLISAIGLGHALVGAKQLFGLPLFRFANPPLLTPFGNPNHLAAFLTLTGPIALGLAVRSTGRRRLLWSVCAVLCGLATFLSLSRGGIAFFVLAELLFVFALWRSGKSARARAPETPGSGRSEARFTLGRRVIFAFGALFLAGVMAADLAGGRIASELATSTQLAQSKIAFWPNLFRAAWKFWPFGMGRGAFDFAYPRFQHVVGMDFTRPENALLQLLCGFGLVPTLVLLALAIRGCRRLGARALTAPELGALCGLAGLLAHDMLDFSLELPACAVAAWVVLGILLRTSEVEVKAAPPEAPAVQPERSPEGGVEGSAEPRAREMPSPSAPRRDSRSPEPSTPARRERGLGGRRAWMPVLALAPLLVVWPAHHRARSAEAALWRRVHAGHTDVVASAERAIARHPADDVLYTAVGWSLLRKSPSEALAWFQRALYLRPWSSGAHLGVARILRASGRADQALLAYRLACEGARWTPLAGKILDEALPLADSEARLETLVGHSELLLREVSAKLMRAGRKADAEGLWTWALSAPELAPLEGDSWLRAARVSLAVGLPKEAYARAGKRLESAPGDPASLLVQVRALDAEGRADEASHLLERAWALHPENESLGLAQANRLLRAQTPREAESVLDRLDPYISEPRARARLMSTWGNVYWAEQRRNRALESYVLAARLDPKVAGFRFQVARAAESLHRIDEAVSAVKAGAALQGPNGASAAKAWLDRLHDEKSALERLRLERATAQDPP